MLKKLSFVLAITALVVGVGASTASAYMFNTDLTLGSTGADVSALQGILVGGGYLTMPAGVPMGTFGPLTQAAVAKWQTASGITPAAGYVGPISRAKLNGTVVTGGTLPAGCASTAGYSSTTGAKCDSGSTLPAGCTSTSGFSVTTGASCASGSTGGSLTGGAGSINDVDQTSSDTESDVQEGKSDVKVLGFDVDADGSDISVTSVRVELAEQTPNVAESDRLNRYVDEVSVWLDGKKVGSADVSDFSKNNGTAPDRDVYSKNIPVSGAVVKENKDGRFYVTVSAVDNIDTADFDADWDVRATQIRYEDGTGAIFSESSAGCLGTPCSEIINFEDLASSGDLKFRVSEGSNNPNATTIEADASNDTTATLLEFKLKAEGSDMVVDTLDFDLTSTAFLSDAIDEISLMNGSTELDSIDGASIAAATTDTVTFEDLADDLDLSDGDSVTLKVVAKVNEVDGATYPTWDSGDSLSASLTSTNRDAADVEDENGDQVLAGDRAGSVTGDAQTFSDTGNNVAPGTQPTPTVTLVDLADNDLGVFTMKVNVTAFDDDVFISQTAATAGTVALQLASTHAAATAPTTASLTISSDADTEGSSYRVNGGETKMFTFVYTVNPATADEGVALEAQLLTVVSGSTSGTPTGNTFTIAASELSKYRTPSVTVPD